MAEVRIMLDNIRSTHNVGSIFRTAETVGVTRIYCVGTTPAPVDRFGRARTDIAKVALGAEKIISWELVAQDDLMDLVKKLKKEGFQIVAVEQSAGSLDYKHVILAEKSLIILGNEVDGVSSELQKRADIIAEIGVKGEKESLNVSVAAGVALFRMMDK